MEIPPELIFRGVAFAEEERLLTESKQMLADTIGKASVEERGDWSVIKEKIIVAETGQILRFGPAGAEIVGKAAVGRVLIDEGSLEEVEEMVIRDRRHISEDGIILTIIAHYKKNDTFAN